MTEYNRGKVGLPGFVFSDEAGGQRRPAFKLNSLGHHWSRQKVVISLINSQAESLFTYNHLPNRQSNAVSFPSLSTANVNTILQSTDSGLDMGILNSKLKQAHGIRYTGTVRKKMYFHKYFKGLVRIGTQNY
jgi:hypothetical protein